MNRKFGVELEVVGGPRGQKHSVAEALCAAGVPTQVQHYNHQTCTGWKIVDDGTLHGLNCFELVSPVLRYPAGLEQVRVVCEVLQSLGVKVNRTCGMHVHVDGAGLTVPALRRLTEYYAKAEQTIDRLVPKSRRGNRNNMLRSVRARLTRISEGRGLRDGLFALANYAAQSTATFANVLGDRYCKLNISSLLRHGTVEFRQHSGTVNYEKIAAWVGLCEGMVAAAEDMTLPRYWRLADVVGMAPAEVRETLVHRAEVLRATTSESEVYA